MVGGVFLGQEVGGSLLGGSGYYRLEDFLQFAYNPKISLCPSKSLDPVLRPSAVPSDNWVLDAVFWLWGLGFRVQGLDASVFPRNRCAFLFTPICYKPCWKDPPQGTPSSLGGSLYSSL